MQITDTTLALLGAPLAAAIISLLGVVVSIAIQSRNTKRQLRSAHSLKMAEMRQDWINTLRAAMAEFQSYGVTPNLDQLSQRQFFEAGTRVELLMNPEDPLFAELQTRMSAFLTAHTEMEKHAANAPYVAACQKILKNEWQLVSRQLNANRL